MPGLPLGRGCATLFMGNRGRPEWWNGDLCHAYSQIPHSHLLYPSLFLTHTLHSLPVPPLWIEEQQIEPGRRRLMSSGFATQHLLWHTKLEQQALSQYAHKLVSYSTEIKKGNWLGYMKCRRVEIILRLATLVKVETLCWLEIQMWSSSVNCTSTSAVLDRRLHAAPSPAVTDVINDDLPWIDRLFKSYFSVDTPAQETDSHSWWTLKNSAKHTPKCTLCSSDFTLDRTSKKLGDYFTLERSPAVTHFMKRYPQKTV